MDDTEARSYYVVKYDWHDDDGNTYVTERIFDIYDDAKCFAESWPADAIPMIEKRFYGSPYTVIRKSEATEADISKMSSQIKCLKVQHDVDEMVIDHLNECIESQKKNHEAIMWKVIKFFNKEFTDVFNQKS